MTIAGSASTRTAAVSDGDESSAAETAVRTAAIAEPSFTGLYPPRPRLTLNVGITGHRATVLPDGVADLLGPVVISMTHAAADVLTVLLLAKWAGCKNIPQIAPLFESVRDLDELLHVLGA